MNSEKLKTAISECSRFLKKARELELIEKQSPYCFYGTKESGAVRRASMDLTRALANLRKPS